MKKSRKESISLLTEVEITVVITMTAILWIIWVILFTIVSSLYDIGIAHEEPAIRSATW